jgi:hypothetical protein
MFSLQNPVVRNIKRGTMISTIRLAVIFLSFETVYSLFLTSSTVKSSVISSRNNGYFESKHLLGTMTIRKTTTALFATNTEKRKILADGHLYVPSGTILLCNAFFLTGDQHFSISIRNYSGTKLNYQTLHERF